MRLSEQVHATADARCGTLFDGRYRLDEVLGVGGTATVFRARDPGGTARALKILHADLCEDDRLRERFLREGYTANSLAHPGAVPVLEHGTDEAGTPFLAMELLDGRSLEDEWRGLAHEVPLRLAVSVACAVLDVLAVAHAKGIVHRDVKPANVFLERTGGVRVLDFGLARLVTSPRVTPTGDTLGTAEFAAPEQARGAAKAVDARADVYSVGAVVYSLLTGRFVHDAPNPMERMIHAATRPAPSLRLHATHAPAALVHVVDKALAFRRDDRFEDARAMSIALSAATRSLDEASQLDAS